MAAVTERPGPWHEVPEVEEYATERARRAHAARVQLIANGGPMAPPPPPPWELLGEGWRRHLVACELAILAEDTDDTRHALTRVLARMLGWLERDDPATVFVWRTCHPAGGWAIEEWAISETWDPTLAGMVFVRLHLFRSRGTDAMTELRAALSWHNALQASTPRVTE